MALPHSSRWLVYLLRCSDGSLYTGITYDLTRRLKTPPRTLAEARSKICTSAFTNTDTMQQMVFQPATGYWKLWVRK